MFCTQIALSKMLEIRDEVTIVYEMLRLGIQRIC